MEPFIDHIEITVKDMSAAVPLDDQLLPLLGFDLRNRSVLVAMRDESPFPRHAVIQPCGLPDKLIVNLTDVQPSEYVRISSPTAANRFLWCYRLANLAGNNIESLEDALWTPWGQAVLKGDFSYDDHSQGWGPYSDKDIRDIAIALGRET